ncbi:MAG: imidazole glycerol phosphate synthase subunit HisH [Candidatus Hadarchaeales archaeon]
MVMKLAVIDYGMGNIKSVWNAFKYLGVEPTIVRSPSKLNAERIVLPGVGSFGNGMKNLRPFVPKILEALRSGTPFLGICLGLHILFEGSEESPGVKGLGLIKGRVVRMPTRLKLPHMGWNSLKIEKECPLFEGLNDAYVYFVHSYHAEPEEDVVAATTQYGCRVTAAVWKGNMYGTQFHPEKSGKVGLKMLENFLKL